MLVEPVLQAKGRKVVTIAPELSVADAARILHTNHIGCAVAVDDTDNSRIVGMFSERDIARGMALHGAAVHAMAVADLMSRDVIVCSPADSLDHLMGVMTNRRVRHLPVVEDGRLVGMISIGDVVKHRLDEAAMEVDSLRNYVMAGR